MTYARTGVAEGFACDGDELPIVARIVQRELEHTEGMALAHLAVRSDGAERSRAPAARADDELPNPPADFIGYKLASIFASITVFCE